LSGVVECGILRAVPKKMKVLSLNFNQKGIGTYRRSFYFSRELARAGHDVTLVTVSRDSRFRRRLSYKRDWCGESSQPTGDGPWIRHIEGPSWGYRFLPGWGSGPLDIWQRFSEILNGDFNVVIGFEHHPNVSWPVYLTKWRRPFWFISDWCDWFAGSSNQFLGWKFAHRVDAYLEERIRLSAEVVSVTSRALFQRAVSLGVPPERLVRIPEGAATDYIFPSDCAEARKRFGLPLDVPILVQVRNGNMCREVRIFNEVLRNVPNALFVFVGKPSNDAAVLAEQLGISRHIVCTGWVSELDYPRYLACADVCVSPLDDNLDDRARWPAKILDFLSAGRATVTNPIGEVEFLLQEHPIAALAGPSDQEMAEEVVSLLEDPERRTHLGEYASRVMKEEWDWRVRGPLIESLLESPKRSSKKDVIGSGPALVRHGAGPSQRVHTLSGSLKARANDTRQSKRSQK